MELQSAFSATTNILVIIFSIYFFLSLIKLQNRYKAKNLPPGPWKLPIIGSLHHLATGSLPQYTLTKLSKIYGPLMHLKLGGISAVVVSSPQMAKLFLKTHDTAFGGRPTTLATGIFTYNYLDIGFSPCNANWQQMRKICTHELLSNRRVRSYSSIREDEVSNLVSFIRRSVGTPFDLRALLSPLTSSIICRTVFSEKQPNKNSLLALIDESLLLASNFYLWDFFPWLSFLAVVSGVKFKLQKIHKEMDTICQDIIDKRREYNEVIEKSGERGNQKEDLLDVLLKLQQENKQEIPVTDINIKAVIFDLFTAGTDSSATVVEWAMSEMINHPRVMERAQSEIRRSLRVTRNIEEIDAQELHYLKMIIKETLRLHPPFPLMFPKECTESCEINGYTIPLKTQVIVNAWSVARDPEFWGEDAENFIPERFEKKVIENNGNNFEYIPFSSGRRICPGISFGLATIETVLVQLLYHYNWKLPNRMELEELDMTDALGFNGRRKNPLYLVADLNKATHDEN